MSGGARRGSPAFSALSLLLLVAPLLAFAPATLASVPRGATALPSPLLAADVDALATSSLENNDRAPFRVFAGDELGDARLLVFELGYPETRVRGFGLPDEARVGDERSLRLGVPWACDESSGGKASGSGKFRIFDPAGVSRSTSAFGWNRLFQGREYIGLIDAYDFRARTLWPELGRFGQEDPAGVADSLNRYQALRAGWTWANDPFGLLTDPQKQAQLAEELLVKKLKAQGWHVFWGGQASHQVLAGGPDVFAYNVKTGDLAFFDDKNWLSKNRVYRSKAQNLLNLTTDKGRQYLRKAELLVMDSNMPNGVKDRLIGRITAKDFSRYVTSAAPGSVVNSVSRQLEREGVLFYDLEKAATATVGDAAKGIAKRIPFVKIGLAVLIFTTVADKSEAVEMVLDPTGLLGSSRMVSTEEELRAMYEQMFLPQLARELGQAAPSESRH